VVRLNNRPKNRFITIRTDDTDELDRWGETIADIIDAYGGTNPYPRFVTCPDGSLAYSFTPKIPLENLAEFNEELHKWWESI